MSGLLQRLAGQAHGANGPRIRSAAAVHAQVPLALPSRASREPSDGARALEGAATSTTFAPMPAASRDHKAQSVRESNIAAWHDTREAERHERLNEEIARQVDGNGEPTPFVPVAAPPAPAALLGQAAAPVLPAAGSIRPALLHEPKEHSSRETTEVHVHIGRIEVTALPAPAAPPPGARAARPTVPLSDYLAKRRSS